MRTNLNRLTCFLACVAVTVPALAQQGAADKPYIVVWLTGELGRARAGVVFGQENKTLGRLYLKGDTTVAAPDGSVWDLSVKNYFEKFVDDSGGTYTIVSPTGSPSDATIEPLPISGFIIISTSIGARFDVFSGGSKVGKGEINGKVTGQLANLGGVFALLPLEDFYQAKGSIVTTIAGQGRHRATITKAILGLLKGNLALGLLGVTEAGEHVTYIMPDFVNVASRMYDVYRGPISKSDSFGFASAPGTALGNGVVGPPKTMAKAQRSQANAYDPKRLPWHIDFGPESNAQVSEANDQVKGGNAKIAKGDMRGAIADYNTAVQLKPNLANAYVYSNRGAAKGATGDLDGAIADSTRAIEINPRLASAYHVRGTARQAKGETEGAIGDFATGLVYVSSDEHEKTMFSVSLALNYHDYHDSGLAKAVKGDMEGAITAFTNAIQMNPDYADAYYDRSNARRAKGDVDGAAADRAKAIQLKPDLARQ